MHFRGFLARLYGVFYGFFWFLPSKVNGFQLLSVAGNLQPLSHGVPPIPPMVAEMLKAAAADVGKMVPS